jgi:hypothetical protein
MGGESSRWPDLLPRCGVPLPGAVAQTRGLEAESVPPSRVMPRCVVGGQAFVNPPFPRIIHGTFLVAVQWGYHQRAKRKRWRQ